MRTRTTLFPIAALLVSAAISTDANAQVKALRTQGMGHPALKRDAGGHIDQMNLQKPRTVLPLPILSTGKHMADQSTGFGQMRGIAPVNDNCANATLLTMGTSCAPTNGTVDQATQSLAAIDCLTFVGNANDDVWYRFVATAANATIYVECNEFFDAVIDLRSGACNGTNIACMDYYIAGGSETLLATGLTVGTTYRFRVYDYEAGYPADPTFSVCVYGTPDAPPNDLCEDATIQDLNVPGAVSVSGDNTGATDTEQFGIASAWEAFTINSCADITLSYCGTPSVFENAFVNLSLDCTGSETFSFTSFDQTSCSDGNYTIFYEGVPAGTYYYPVLSEPGSSGSYTIEFSAVACGGGGGPENDLCSTAIPVDLEAGSTVEFSGTTVDATNTNDMVPGSILDVGGDTVTVWHAFTTTECTDIAVSYCGTSPLPTTYWAFLSQDCPAGDDALFFQDFSFELCGDDNPTLYYFGVPAGTYYLPVRGEPSTVGPYQVQVTATACANAGPYCDAGAVSTAFEKISNVTVAGIDNASTSGLGYENFTNVVGNMVQGQSYPISIEVSGGYDTDQGLVWIDFDQSDSFEESELVFTGDGVGPYTGTVAVPVGATLGETRMRIRLHDTYDLGVDYQNTPNPTPCDTSTYGQVEDYTIMIGAGVEPPANDQCGDVTPEDLSVGGSLTFSGDNTGATMTGDYEPGSLLEGTGSASVWHAFTTTECANVTVSYCGVDPSFLNFWIILATSCPANDDLVFNSSFNTTECGDGNATIYYNNLPAGTWYLPVLMDPSTEGLAVGPYTVEVSASACLPGPSNDECDGAIMLDVNLDCQPVQGTVLDATESLPAIVCNAFEGVANDDVWYSFVATGPNQTITVDGTDTLDAVIQLFEGECGALAELDCADATLGGGVEQIVATDLVEGTTYLVRVYDFYNGYPIEPTFDICVTGDVGTTVAEEAQGGFSLLPNPAEDQVNIVWNGPGGIARLEILDVAGRLVQSGQFNLIPGANTTLDLSGDISSGMYTVRLTTGDLRAEQRLLVK